MKVDGMRMTNIALSLVLECEAIESVESYRLYIGREYMMFKTCQRTLLNSSRLLTVKFRASIAATFFSCHTISIYLNQVKEV